MRRSMAAGVALGWGLAVGVTFGCLLPYLLGYWHARQPLPYWVISQAAGVALIGVGLIPIGQSFHEFV